MSNGFEPNYPNGMLDRDQRTALTLTLPIKTIDQMEPQKVCENCKIALFHTFWIEPTSFDIQCDNCWKLKKYYMDKKYKLNNKTVNKFHKSK